MLLVCRNGSILGGGVEWESNVHTKVGRGRNVFSGVRPKFKLQSTSKVMVMCSVQCMSLIDNQMLDLLANGNCVIWLDCMVIRVLTCWSRMRDWRRELWRFNSIFTAGPESFVCKQFGHLFLESFASFWRLSEKTLFAFAEGDRQEFGCLKNGLAGRCLGLL